jgi:hypothetical protein
MSIDSTRNSISRIEKEIARLDKQLSDEVKKESDKNKKLIQIDKSINKNTSLSSLRSKQNQMVTVQNDIAKIVKKKADIGKKIADKKAQINRYQQQLDREVKSERNKQELSDKRRQQDELRYQQQITEELRKQKEQSQVPTDSDTYTVSKDHDFFISHASEDKESFVRPLAEKLIDLGLNVWYDEFKLKIGDSLRRSIDNGLKNSKFGIVVLSSSFFAKNWTQYELDGLVTKEMNGVKVILPIWHKVSKDEVVSYSPTLADKVALNTSIMSIDEIATELKELIDE